MLTPQEARRLLNTVSTYCLLFLFVFFIPVFIAHASGTPVPETVSSKDVILILFSVLQAILMAIAVWMVSKINAHETRLANAETKQATRDALCEERNEQGTEHLHKRKTDEHPEILLKELLGRLREQLYVPKQ